MGLLVCFPLSNPELLFPRPSGVIWGKLKHCLGVSLLWHAPRGGGTLGSFFGTSQQAPSWVSSFLSPPPQQNELLEGISYEFSLYLVSFQVINPSSAIPESITCLFTSFPARDTKVLEKQSLPRSQIQVYTDFSDPAPALWPAEEENHLGYEGYVFWRKKTHRDTWADIQYKTGYFKSVPVADNLRHTMAVHRRVAEWPSSCFLCASEDLNP